MTTTTSAATAEAPDRRAGGRRPRGARRRRRRPTAASPSRPRCCRATSPRSNGCGNTSTRGGRAHDPRRPAPGAVLACSCRGLSLLAVPAAAVAQPAPPVLTAPVNDFADVIDAASRARARAAHPRAEGRDRRRGRRRDGPTFQPYGDIDEYAVKMFENGGRGIGEKGKDNGLLIVVAVDDRKRARSRSATTSRSSSPTASPARRSARR